jgi:hypothetical protein
VRHAQTGLHVLREGKRRKVVALRLDDQANGFAVVDVQHALLDQVGVDRRVEPAVVHDVVDVAVGIVVHPAGADGAKHR